MAVSCLTIYAIAFSCVTLLGRTDSTAAVQVDMTGRQSDRRSSKVYFNNHIRTNASIDMGENSKTSQKMEEKRWKLEEKPKVSQSSFLPSNSEKPENLSADPNGSHSYFALFDTVYNKTKKMEVSGQSLPAAISRSDFEDLTRSKKEEKRKKGRFFQNFVEWDVLQDSEKEVRIHYNGITAKETVVKTGVDEETGKRQGLKLRQLTDGTHFIQLIYNFDDQIQDCEYIRQKNVIQKFLNSFRENVEKAKSAYEIEESQNEDVTLQRHLDEEEEDYLEDDEGKIEKYSLDEDDEQFEGEDDEDFGHGYRNVTFQIIRREEDLPREVAEWMNYPRLKRKCRENHKILKQLAFDKAHGDENAKKLAEEHIERRKRDIMDVLLVPGTKWCGKGRRATKYTSLGGFSRTDKCCRVHDTMCPHWIGSLEKKYGFFNWRINTIMHCRCDKRFRACLKMAKTGTANFVGKLFFNVVQTKCFVLKPQEECLTYSWWGKCEKKAYRKKAYLRDNLSY